MLVGVSQTKYCYSPKIISPKLFVPPTVLGWLRYCLQNNNQLSTYGIFCCCLFPLQLDILNFLQNRVEIKIG